MSDKELVNMSVAKYMDLLRIEKAETADGMKREVANQKRELRIQLEAMGIPVEELRID